MMAEAPTKARTKPPAGKDCVRRDKLIQALYQVEGKAEIINGEIVHMPATGIMPALAGGEIFASLREYARAGGIGRAVPDGCAFVVELPHRDSFGPDVAWYTGPSDVMQFAVGAPVFAVEVRSDGDYGPRAERKMAAKRADYFACGTKVVWDVDLLAREVVVRKYTPESPDSPAEFRRGEVADAEPAVPGWSLAVDRFFD